MNELVKYGAIAAVIVGIYFFANSGDEGYAEDEIDLNAVLDVTVDTMHKFQGSIDGQENLNNDAVFLEFGAALQTNYNTTQPALYKSSIGVKPQTDASLLAYEDLNTNDTIDEGENKLFLIEIDGENARIIASSRSGAVNDHHFSGTSLLAGYLIGSMLARQRGAGVNSKSLANKKTVTARSAARARAGSGSHSRGK